MGKDLTSAAIKRLIVERHEKMNGEWAIAFELADGTGYQRQGRYMDVFAMGLWPSHKFHRIGYEVKISRADFLRELKDPAKRAWAVELTNEFWYVAPSKVIEPTELPPECGLLLVTGENGRLRTQRAAPQRPAPDLTMPQLAAFVRRIDAKEFRRSMRFRHLGRDLTDEDLTRILGENRKRLEEEEIHRRADELVKKQMENIHAALTRYAEALQKAGCNPPPWMLNGGGGYVARWDADRWVKTNVKPGPHGQAAETLRLQLNGLTTAAKDMLASLDPVQ